MFFYFKILIVEFIMSLVAYDNSDNSSNDSDNEDKPSPLQNDEVKPTEKRVNNKVKILIPSIPTNLGDSDDSSDNEAESVKKRKPPNRLNHSKSSGLLAVLPPVKSTPITTKTFVPKSVQQPKRKTNRTNSLILDSVEKQQITTSVKKGTGATPCSESDEDDDNQLANVFDDELWRKVCGHQNKRSTKLSIIKETPKPVVVERDVVEEQMSVNCAPEPAKPYEGLDNEAFKRLVGKHQRPHLNYKLIDVNEADVLSDKDMWLMKSMTDPNEPSTSCNSGQSEANTEIQTISDPTKRRKHHITYLAEQARANEQKLKEQWSANRNARIQSRSKYGF